MFCCKRVRKTSAPDVQKLVRMQLARQQRHEQKHFLQTKQGFGQRAKRTATEFPTTMICALTNTTEEHGLTFVHAGIEMI